MIMKKRMKIAIIVPSNLPIPSVKGGAIETLVDELIAVNEQEKKLDIVVYSCKNQEAKDKAKKLQSTKVKYIDTEGVVAHLFARKRYIRNRFVKYNKTFDSWFIKKACRDILKENVDYIIIEGDKVVAEAIKKRIDKPLILHLHNEMNSNSDYVKQIAKSVDYYFTVSDYIGEKVSEVPGVEKSNVFTIHNCVDVNKFNKALYQRERESIRKKFKVKKEDLLLIFTGRIVPEKGVLELIEAVSKLDNNIKLMILGAPTFDERKMTKYSKKVENAMRKQSNKIFMTGYIEYKDIPQYYTASDIAVIPSLWEEPAALTVFEAQATGIACIVTKSGGIIEYCNDTTAIKIDKDKNVVVDNLIEAIKFLESHPEERIKLGANGHKHMRKYSIDNYYKEYVNALNKINEEENK